jgi:lysophospholipase L1-like esterase
MKTLFTLSIALNLLVLAGLSFVFVKKGGVGFVRAKYVEMFVDSPYAEPGSPYHESTYYRAFLSQFDEFPATPESVIFLGDSHVERGMWAEFLNMPILNRGISGEEATSLAWRMERALTGNPAQAVILTGANDARLGTSSDTILSAFVSMLDTAAKVSPNTEIILCTIPPFGKGLPESIRINRTVREVNEQLVALTDQRGVTLVDLAAAVSHPDGDLNLNNTFDHLHFNSTGFAVAARTLAPFLKPPSTAQVVSRVSTAPEPVR